MADILTPDRIISTLDAANKLRVIEKLSCFAATRIGLDDELVRQRVLTSEDLTTFGIGRGIALPHATVPGISEPIGLFARLKRPVDFGAVDGRPADLVFFLLAPEEDPGILLRALSCVARRLRDRDVVKRLRAEDNPEAAYVFLTTDSWRTNDAEPAWKHTA